jgi:acyl-CoA thioesterase
VVALGVFAIVAPRRDPHEVDLPEGTFQGLKIWSSGSFVAAAWKSTPRAKFPGFIMGSALRARIHVVRHAVGSAGHSLDANMGKGSTSETWR